jgi:NDP-sugar pyrophosphorylase family protein
VLIGAGAEVKNAYLAAGASIGPLSYVADSILEEKVFLGAMVRTSNYRLDGKTVSVMHKGERVDTHMMKLGCYIESGASLGVQCIVFPGRFIVGRTIFGPRINIERNYPIGRYTLKQELTAQTLD